MKFKYTKYRHGEKLVERADSLNEALYSAYCDLEYDNAWPYEIWEGESLLWSNNDGRPLTDGTCDLNDKIREYAVENGLE